MEDIRDELIKLIQALNGTPAQVEVERYIPEMFDNVRISQTTSMHKDKLIAARDYLRTLKDRLGQQE